MPRANIWIKEENYEEWQKIENKSGWINDLLQLNKALDEDPSKFGLQKPEDTPQEAEIVPYE